MKQRGLADSKYNERRAECEAAVTMLKQKLNIDCLGDVSVETFEAYKHLITDATVLKRAEHVVTEDDRVRKAMDALNAGDIVSFGRLMNQSHDSLKNLYEVTGAELDALADAALTVDGVFGSRMTGAGFGGCTVSVVDERRVDDFIKTVGEKYFNKTGLTAEFYVAEAADGARRIYA